jgi:hypothetical protein
MTVCSAVLRSRLTYPARVGLPLMIASVVASLQPAAALAARSGSTPGLRVQPGIYLSDSVVLSLDLGGAFLLQELGGTRRASGRYTSGPGTLTFAAGQGDVGKTRFPFTCRLGGAFGGFAMLSGQAGCKPFSGLSFRAAN